jgi:hypothetical protein
MNETRNFTLARKIPMACRNCPAAAAKKREKKSNPELFTTFGKIKINKKEIFPSCFLSAFLFNFHHTSSFSQLTTAGPNILYYTPPTDPHPPDLYLAARPCWDDEAIE